MCFNIFALLCILFLRRIMMEQFRQIRGVDLFRDRMSRANKHILEELVVSGTMTIIVR